jgi:Holliday junction resolvase-like predicted endonuclease
MALIHRDYSKTRQKGNLGEDVACLFLMKHGFKIVGRNYLKPWGEIDIIAEKSEKLYFVEVKSVSVEIPKVRPPYGGLTFEGVSRETLDGAEKSVTHETFDRSHTSEGIRPEENMTGDKLKRLERTIKTYLIEKKISRETTFHLDLITVKIDTVRKMAVVERFVNVGAW